MRRVRFWSFPVAALLLPLAHAAGGGAGGESHSFWQNFLTPPPLHPVLVNFTAALIPASFVSDFLGRVLRKDSLRAAGFWTLFYAAIVTPFTALAGWLWLNDAGDMGHAEMVAHQWVGTALPVLMLPLLFWRWKLHRANATPGVSYLIASALLVATLTVQGHLGGMMSFGAGDSGGKTEGVGHHEHGCGGLRVLLHRDGSLRKSLPQRHYPLPRRSRVRAP